MPPKARSVPLERSTPALSEGQPRANLPFKPTFPPQAQADCLRARIHLMSIKITAVILLSCVGLAACNGMGSSPATSAAMSPVSATSSNGGGQRALGDIPSEGVNSGAGATSSGVPNGKGTAY